MTGWVYVISNQAMPNLIKVGFSGKDPELRASELNHTGSPHPFVVDYQVLVEHPRDIEQQTHRKLSEYREGREWFRCSAELAVSTIQEIVGVRAITESFKWADRLKAEQLRREHEEDRKKQVRIEALWQEQEQQIRTNYEERLEKDFPKPPTLGYIVISFLLALLALAALVSKKSDGQLLFWSLLIAFLAGPALKHWHRGRQENSDRYKSVLKRRDEELLQVRKLTISCPRCGLGLRIPREKNLRVTCPKCRHEFPYGG